MLPISVCLIAKNEENCIEECLKRLRPYSWEIIVADTGSTDRTVELASRYADRILHFTWCNDFGAARNFVISQASHPFILNIDCDEFLLNQISEDEMTSLLTPFLSKKQEIGRISLRNPRQTNGTTTVSSESVGRFFHRDYFQYEGSVHEQVVPADPRTKSSTYAYYTLPLTFHHSGYETAEILKRKTTRNLELLQKELTEKGEDPYTLFQMGQCHFALGDYETALEEYGQGLTYDLDPGLEYVQTMVTSYGYCLVNLKRFEEALSLEGVYQEFSGRADFLFLMGLVYMNNGLFDQAVEEFEKATATPLHTVEGTNSYLAYYNIGVIYECTGDKKHATEYYHKCGDYANAKSRLNALEQI